MSHEGGAGRLSCKATIDSARLSVLQCHPVLLLKPIVARHHVPVFTTHSQPAVPDPACRAKLHTDRTAQAFGLKMDAQPKMMEIPARVLPQPRLAYGNNVHMDPGQKGDWNLMNQK